MTHAPGAAARDRGARNAVHHGFKRHASSAAPLSASLSANAAAGQASDSLSAGTRHAAGGLQQCCGPPRSDERCIAQGCAVMVPGSVAGRSADARTRPAPFGPAMYAGPASASNGLYVTREEHKVANPITFTPRPLAVKLRHDTRAGATGDRRTVRRDGSLAVHRGASCAGCGASPIVGTLYTSSAIRDYHLCDACARRVPHPYAMDATDVAAGEAPSAVLQAPAVSTFGDNLLGSPAVTLGGPAFRDALSVSGYQPPTVDAGDPAVDMKVRGAQAIDVALQDSASQSWQQQHQYRQHHGEQQGSLRGASAAVGSVILDATGSGSVVDVSWVPAEGTRVAAGNPLLWKLASDIATRPGFVRGYGGGGPPLSSRPGARNDPAFAATQGRWPVGGGGAMR